jgi:hypothetical protein
VAAGVGIWALASPLKNGDLSQFACGLTKGPWTWIVDPSSQLIMSPNWVQFRAAAGVTTASARSAEASMSKCIESHPILISLVSVGRFGTVQVRSIDKITRQAVSFTMDLPEMETLFICIPKRHIAHDLQESGEENERCEYYDHNESLRETAKNFLKRYAADILILVRILVMIA